MRTLGALFCVVIGTSACAAAPQPVSPVEVAVSATPRSMPAVLSREEEDAPVTLVPSGDPIRELPPAWAAPPLDAKDFASALQKARSVRDAYGQLAPPTASDAATRAWFAKAVAIVDLASRTYAVAFHAADAPPDGRVDAIAEAAGLELAFALRLDELGILEMPGAWRSDPALRLTFEEVATGPMKKWRDEARALARRCVEATSELHVDSDAGRRCAAIERAHPVARAARKNGDACACAPGDPLCSASLGGWCR